MRLHFEQQGIEQPTDLFPPDLHPGAELYANAYQRLSSTDRPFALGGMGGVMYGRITSLAIERYAIRHGIEGDDFRRFDRMICAIDAVELPEINKQANKKPDA